jgi:oligoendopeptidase F
MPAADLDQKAADPALVHYQPWLRNIRATRGHDLSNDLEELLSEEVVAGSAGWERLYDETVAELRFPFRGRELTDAEVSDLFSDRNVAIRSEIRTTVGEVLARQSRVFTLVTNMLAKDKQIEDKWRKFARPISARNLENHVEDQVVDALIATVHANYPNLSHRYYRLKARWFRVKQLPFWDLSAPLPEEDDRRMPWSEAQRIVLAAYRAFSPEMATIGERFFRSHWIDAPARPGKNPGSFAEPTVPSLHPYLLLNYQGRLDDVLTLAHELGHGIHMMLCAQQGFLMVDPPATLAETASLFGEMLVLREMLAHEVDPRRRKVIIAHQVEDMLASVTHQVAFTDFETGVHEERRGGELTADQICEIWMAVMGRSLGPAVRLDPPYRYYWADIPHFVHQPFYVYAYAFGNCLVNTLFATSQDTPNGFVDRYLTMLRAGGTLRHRELLAPLGLDAGDLQFWQRGLGIISGLIDELEALS